MPRNALLTIENDGSLVHNCSMEDLRFRFEESRKQERRECGQRVGSTAAGKYIKEHDEKVYKYF